MDTLRHSKICPSEGCWTLLVTQTSPELYKKYNQTFPVFSIPTQNNWYFSLLGSEFDESCWLDVTGYLPHPPPRVGLDNSPVNKPNTEGTSHGEGQASVWRFVTVSRKFSSFSWFIMWAVITSCQDPDIFTDETLQIWMKVCEIFHENDHVCALIFCKILNKKNEATNNYFHCEFFYD